jgi:cytochrome c oxidase subunit 1
MGAVFGVVVGIVIWFPLFCDKALNETLINARFWSLFIGVNLTFFPHHFLGLRGMPRRYGLYLDYFEGFHLLRSFGSYLRYLSLVLISYAILESLFTRSLILTLNLVNREFNRCQESHKRYALFKKNAF